LIVTTSQYGAAGFIGWLIIGVPVALISLCIWRVYLECLILFFRIYEDVHVMAGQPRDRVEPTFSTPGVGQLRAGYRRVA
jgi:hypothetical protein